MSKATRQLRLAPSSRCAQCGRITKTTPDGICADCWGARTGRRFLVRRGGRETSSLTEFLDRLDDLVGWVVAFGGVGVVLAGLIFFLLR